MSGLFDNLRVRNVEVMLQLLSTTKRRRREYLHRRYNERANSFDATLSFLQSCGLVEERDRILDMNKESLSTDLKGMELSRLLIERLFAPNSIFREECLTYISRFDIVDGQVVYRPTGEQRSADSALRNLLMDLAVVSYDNINGRYVLAPSQYSLYVYASREACAITPSELEGLQVNRGELGLSAEHEIMSFERQRVGTPLAHRVVHVAVTDASAGYDIESVTVYSGCELVPRLIEVKAVPLHDYRFYWTANEIGMARALGCWYHLYLLPIGTRGQSLLDQLWIICDPSLAVLGSADTWDTDCNVVECRMRRDT